MIYGAIDPGFSGGVFLKEDDNLNFIVGDSYTLDTIVNGKKRKEYNEEMIRNVFSKASISESLIVLEKSQPYPNQGGISNFSTGFGYGLFRGLLTGLNIPFVVIHPKTWQKVFGISNKRGDIKLQSEAVAGKYFSEVEFRTLRGRLLDGLADAACMCLYAELLHKGKID